MPSDGGAAWSPPAGSGERRLSNSSDGSTCSGYSKTTSDAGSIDPSRPRVAKPIGARPPANALQFVKVGPCDLYRSAQEQLKRAEAVKKSKEVKKEEAEDWQSNLDNWKSSRRKRVDHIIQRCAEVRRLEAEPQPRAKGKTFNEMMEERAGKRRRCPLTLYPDDEVTDLSDLGIGTSSTKSSLSEDCDTQSLASDGVDLDKNHSDVDNMSNCDMGNRKLESSANEYDTCTTNTISSPEPEEYTYEGAIEGYKSRIISQTHTNIQFKEYTNNNNISYEKEKSPEKLTNGDINLIRTTVSTKIEEKLSSLQQDKSVPALDANSNSTIVKKDLPKVDILKRRELFEKDSSPETFQNSRARNRSFGDLTNPKPLKERLISLEKREDAFIQPKPVVDTAKVRTEVKSSIKDRLSSLSKCVSSETDKTNLRLSNGDLVNARSLKDRLSSFKSHISDDEGKIAKIEVKEVSQSLKQRLSSLEAARTKEVSQTISEKETKAIPEPIFNESEENYPDNSVLDSQMQNFCRSLDSLDINESSSHNHFERVQSFEDFQMCGESNNVTSPSDIETEDSGVHTAGSCAVSQGDDTGEVSDIANVETLAGEHHSHLPLEPESNDNSQMSIGPSENLEIIEEQKYCYVEDPIEVQEQSEQMKQDESEASSKEFHQALSHLDDDISVTEESTEFQLDKEEMDEDTLKSIDQHDVSVLDALELAFEVIDTEDAEFTNTKMSSTHKSDYTKPNTFSEVKISEEKLTSKTTRVENYQTRETNTIEKKETEQNMNVTFKTQNVTQKMLPEPNSNKEFVPVYENIDIFYENGGVFPISLDGDADGASFPLDMPLSALEPPKEKPPPPPIEESADDELLGNGNFKSTSSTRRIKKEIRNKRSSFLGIEGQLDDTYLDAGLQQPRPDITSFLQEETRVDKLLFKKTLGHDASSALRESRDSGVDLDRPADSWGKQVSSPEDSSQPHSRQNSEPYTGVTVTSDEEETIKHRLNSKRRSSTDNQNTRVSDKDGRFSEHLNNKLENLRREAREHYSDRSRPLDQDRIESIEKQIQEQQTRNTNGYHPEDTFDDTYTKEVLRFERELLQLEQEELKRQRDNLLLRESHAKRLINKSVQDMTAIPNGTVYPQTISDDRYGKQNGSHRHSMPNLLVNQELGTYPSKNLELEGYSTRNIERAVFVGADDQKIQGRNAIQSSTRPPPPVPPSKRSVESQEREITMRSSRVPSASDYANVQLRHKPLVNGHTQNIQSTQNAQYHPMSRHTLQVLSAAPTTKLMSGADWMGAPRRKPAPRTHTYNQHWLIQEAEQRRIEEQRNSRQRYSQPIHNQRPTPIYQPGSPEQRSQHTIPPQPEPRSHIHTGRTLQQFNVRNSDPGLLAELRTPSSGLSPADPNEKMLSVSGRKKCSHCGEELGRGAAMIIESLHLLYHVRCFSCSVCGAALGDGRAGADVRVRARRLHCHHCYSSDDGLNFSRV